MSTPNLDTTHYTAKYAFTTLIALHIACPLLGLAPVLPERSALFVFSFFALRDLVVAPVLAPLLPRRSPVVRWRQLLTGIVHSAITGGLSALLVISHQHYEIDHTRRTQGEPPSQPPNYRGMATSISGLCAIVQLLANVVHVLRAGPAAPETSNKNQQATLSRKDTDHKVIRRLTGAAYVGFVIFGFVQGAPAVGALMGLPVLAFVPLFFFLRDSVIGVSLPRPRAVGRWTDKVFESTLAGAAIGFLMALLVSFVRTKMRPSDGQYTPTSLPAFATTGAQIAMFVQIVGNIW